MNDARAIANYFIDKADAGKRPLTAMTLLKIMYFSHAWYLAIHKKPLIGQPFEAWQYGPVNRVVYDQLKSFGDKPIRTKLKIFSIDKVAFTEAEYSFDEETDVFLSEMYQYYSHFHAFKLSDLTHEKGSPWDQVWNETSRGSNPGMIISDDLIRCWFAAREALYWGGRMRETLS